MIRPSDVHPANGLGTVDGWTKQLLAGKVALAVRRRRKVPRNALRARAARAGDPPVRQTVPAGPVRAVYLLPAGPGSWDDVADVVESIEHFEGAGAQVVIVDDATPDVRAAVVRARFPRAIVLTRRIGSGGPPGMWPLFADALTWVHRHLDPEVVVKLDTDALVTGPGLGRDAAAAFAADPSLGMLGTSVLRADGEPVEHTYPLWVVAHERRWSRSIRRLVEAAEANGWDGENAQAGACVFSRRVLDRAAEAGWLAWRAPWWTLLHDDVIYGLFTRAVGLRTGSWGGPGEPIASGQYSLPIDKQRVLDEGVRAVHTVRRGAGGESEAELRAFFRAARASVPAAAA